LTNIRAVLGLRGKIVERINRPGDDFRERLSRDDVERICQSHGLPAPSLVVPERRGNETVAYHLDHAYFLSFGLCDPTQRKVEVLRIFEHLESMPTPRVIAWSERDSKLGVPYMIVEDCPGQRLDVLWGECQPVEREELLEVLGSSMGRYHTTTIDQATAAAATAGFSQWVIDDTEPRYRRGRERRIEACRALERLPERLARWAVDGTSLTALIEDHYAGRLPPPDAPFAGPGLIHTEPCAEHFLIERTGGTCRLSGCVDLEECAIADSLDEVVEMYVSMLALDVRYLSAFRKGYEQFHPFPADVEQRLEAGAVDHDLSSVLWLLDTMEERPEWSFATSWLSGHVRRLGGWLDERKGVTEALFRKDIGPW
jgi:hypothetical protein